MEHLGKLPIGFFSKNISGSIQKVMDENIEKLEGIIAHMMPDLIGSFVVLLSLFAGIGYLNIIMAITVFVSVLIAFLFQYMIFGSESAKEQYASYMKASNNITRQQGEGHTHPKDVGGKTHLTRADKRLGHKAVEQLVHLVRQPIKRVCHHRKQCSIHHPSFPSARLA